MLARTACYDYVEIVKKTMWRNVIPKGWSGCKPLQYAIPGIKFTTLMQVPSSRNGRLIKMLAKAKPCMAKLCGYQAKYVGKSGTPLSHMFPQKP